MEVGRLEHLLSVALLDNAARLHETTTARLLSVFQYMYGTVKIINTFQMEL